MNAIYRRVSGEPMKGQRPPHASCIQALRRLGPTERARRLGRVSARWLQEEYGPRRRAIKSLKRRALYAPGQSQRLIEGLFGPLSAEGLRRLLPRDRTALSAVPEWCLQVHASTSPQPAIEAVALSLLVGCGVVLRPSRSDPGLLMEYVASLRREDPILGRCIMSGTDARSALAPMLRRAPLVIAYGSDETLEALRRKVGVGTRWAGHGHRISLSVVTARALRNSLRITKGTALDVWMDRQQGCLSPRVIYVEGGGEAAEIFTERLADELETLTQEDPMTPSAERDAVSRLRSLYRLRAALGERIVWRERIGRGRYAVMYDEKLGREPDGFVPLCVCVKAYKDRQQLVRKLGRLRGSIQGIALGAASNEALSWKCELRKLEPALITVPGRLQFPPLNWHHDNKPRLSDWLSK